MCQARRGGFTLLELLVVMGIISILMAMLLPAVQHSREAARATECKSNLRNLGIAMTAVADNSRRFPASGTFSAATPDGFESWVLELLPWLEQSILANAWDRKLPFNHPANHKVGQTGIPVLICPSDISIASGQGNLSYVVNGGFAWTEPVDCPVTNHLMEMPAVWSAPIDLNGNGVICPSDPSDDGPVDDQMILFQTGMFFVENVPLGTGTVRHHRMATVLDGLSNTITISENVRAGYDPNDPLHSGWSSPEPWRNCFFLSGYVCDNLTCAPGNVDYSRANSQSQVPEKFEAINSSRTQAEGQAPWPSSFHTGGVHMLFGDGHVRFLSEGVDGRTYAALVTPQGSSAGGALRDAVIPSGDF
jgi:prepilin-type N-terminal cleavage/methylation domain-containing protein/prepilin-type processing-associated H-X9-DG protein